LSESLILHSADSPSGVKLTKEFTEQFYSYIAQGSTIKGAAAMCRMSVKTVEEWVYQGRCNKEAHDSDPGRIPLNKYGEFFTEVERIRALWTFSILKKFTDSAFAPKATPLDKANLMELQARLDSEFWGRKATIKHEGDSKLTVEHVFADGNGWQTGQVGRISGADVIDTVLTETVAEITDGGDDA